MPLPLNDIKTQLRDAVAAGDTAAVRSLMGQFVANRKARDKSMANIAADEKTYGPVAEGGGRRFLEGVGSGYVNVARRGMQMAANHAIPDFLESDALHKGEEAALGITDQEATDAPLLKTGLGTGGRLVGEIAATAPLTGGSGAIAETLAARLGGRMLPGAIKTLGGIAQAAGEGALGGEVTTGKPGEGALYGGALHGLAGSLRKLAQGTKRTESAQRLLDAGVDLTPGQMNPKGVLNQVEQAMESLPFVSQAIKPAREAAERSIMPALVRDATGLPHVAGEQLDDLMQRAVNSFDNRYGQFKDIPVHGPVQTAGIRRALADPGILANDQERQAVSRFVAQQIQRLPRQRGAATTVGDLMAVRSAIRKAANAANKAGNIDRAALLDAADQSFTQTINHAMPRTSRSMLRAVDDDYARYKTWSKAVHSARDRPKGPTLPEARGALAREMTDSAYNRGARRAGDRRFLQDASEAFETVSAPTGARLLTLGGAMGAGTAAGGPLGAAIVPVLSTLLAGPGRRFAQGGTAIQRGMRSAAQNPEIADIIEALRRTRGAQAGALTEDN